MSSLRSCSVSVIYCKSESVSCHETQCYLVLTVKTTVLLGKRMYQTSLEIKGGLAFTNNVKGLHLFMAKIQINFSFKASGCFKTLLKLQLRTTRTTKPTTSKLCNNSDNNSDNNNYSNYAS